MHPNLPNNLSLLGNECNATESDIAMQNRKTRLELPSGQLSQMRLWSSVLFLNGRGLYRGDPSRSELMHMDGRWGESLHCCCLCWPVLTTFKDDWSAGWTSGLGELHYKHTGLFGTLNDGSSNANSCDSLFSRGGKNISCHLHLNPSTLLCFLDLATTISSERATLTSRDHHIQGDQGLLVAGIQSFSLLMIIAKALQMGLVGPAKVVIPSVQCPSEMLVYELLYASS